jgi:hypothetical protein
VALAHHEMNRSSGHAAVTGDVRQRIANNGDDVRAPCVLGSRLQQLVLVTPENDVAPRRLPVVDAHRSSCASSSVPSRTTSTSVRRRADLPHQPPSR